MDFKKLTEELGELEEFTYFNEKSFLDTCFEHADELISIYFAADYVGVIYLTGSSGQHFSDSIQMGVFQNWYESRKVQLNTQS